MLFFAIVRVLLNVRAHLHQDANALRGQEEPAGHPSHPGQQWSAQNTTIWEYKIQDSNDLHKKQQAKKSILKIQNTTMQWYAQNKEKWEY